MARRKTNKKEKSLSERTIAMLDKHPRKKFTYAEMVIKLNRGTKKTVNTGALGTVAIHLPKKYSKRIVQAA